MSQVILPTPEPTVKQPSGRAQSGVGDRIFRGVTFTCAAVIALTALGILIQLYVNSGPSREAFGWGFLFSSDWSVSRDVYGAASSIYGTLVSTLIAMALATPLAILISLFLVELAPHRLSKFVGGGLELLAAIPSIIYGMWGLFVLAPLMQDYVQPALQGTLGFLPLFQGSKTGFGLLTAGVILALMILPFITAITRDVLMMVPPVMKESAYGLGATTWEMTYQVSLRHGVQGIVAGLFLGLGRAIGETMAVTFVIGNNHEISASLFSASNTIASSLANEFAEADSTLHESSLIQLGLILFVITLVFQVLAQLWLRGLRRKVGAR